MQKTLDECGRQRTPWKQAWRVLYDVLGYSASKGGFGATATSETAVELTFAQSGPLRLHTNMNLAAEMACDCHLGVLTSLRLSELRCERVKA